MKSMKILIVLSIALMFTVVLPQGANAQGLCGEDCCWCGGSPDHIGGCPAHGGDYSAFCDYSWWFCEGCAQTLLNDLAIEAEDLAKLLEATEASDLAPFVRAYSERMLLVPEPPRP